MLVAFEKPNSVQLTARATSIMNKEKRMRSQEAHTLVKWNTQYSMENSNVGLIMVPNKDYILSMQIFICFFIWFVKA